MAKIQFVQTVVVITVNITMYLPRKIKKSEHFAVYKEAKGEVKTKAAVLKEALGIAVSEDEHQKWIDFIPAKFTLQVHGWFPKGTFKNLKEAVDFIHASLKAGGDPVKDLEKKKGGKFHYDLRIQKATAPTWFGLTPFRAPWTGTMENKVMGTVKGYQSIAPGGAKLQKFLMEQADKEMAKEGIAERQDKLEWMKIKAQWFPVDSPGNPQKNEEAIMVAIEFFKPAVLHRRELDFVDCTFLGDYLKGRFYNRLVERKVNPNELLEWQKKDIAEGKAKEFYDLSFYFWKAKDQFDLKEMLQIALRKKTKDRILAPPSKIEPKEKAVKEAPLASQAFH